MADLKTQLSGMALREVGDASNTAADALARIAELEAVQCDHEPFRARIAELEAERDAAREVVARLLTHAGHLEFSGPGFLWVMEYMHDGNERATGAYHDSYGALAEFMARTEGDT